MSTINEALDQLKALRPEEQPKEQEIEEAIEAEGIKAGEEDIQEEQETAPPETDEAEGEPPTEVQEPDTGAETLEIEADQLAEILALENDRLVVEDDGIRFRAKIGNETEDVTLDQLINAYQGDKVLTNRSKEVAKIEQAQKEHLNDLANKTNQFAQQSAAVLEALKDVFVSPYSEAEMKTLREDDPAEYAARKQEIAEREKQFSNLVNQAVTTSQSSQQVQSEEYQRQYAEYLQNEHQRTLEAIPNWKSVEGDVAKYVTDSLGFTADEIKQIADNRLLKAFYQSMQYEKGQTGAKTKLVKKVPKVLKGGNRPSKDQVSLEAQAKAQQRLKQTGDWRDAVAALKSRR